MKVTKFEIIIASLPNREHPVAEIYYDIPIPIQELGIGDPIARK